MRAANTAAELGTLYPLGLRSGPFFWRVREGRDRGRELPRAQGSVFG